MEGQYKLFAKGGHAFQVNESGKLKTWEHEHHDGYFCVFCGEALCRNCTKDWKTEKCPEDTPVLPGMELKVTHESSGNGES
jgi:hypothetical protein